METLNKLFDQLETSVKSLNVEIGKIKDDIQAELSAQYENWDAMQKVLAALEGFEGVEYCSNQYGDAEAWVRFNALSDVLEREREYFEEHISAAGIAVDWENETLSQSLGPDEIFINDSGRPYDRGVYQSGKCIIAEGEYTDDNGEIDETLRNELIESHMERSGHFPGVFRTSYHDNCLYPVSTVAPKTKAKG